MENRHYPGELEQMQSLPLEIKIRMTKMRIQQWYYAFDGMVYISFSGGKDSTVLLHLANQMFPDIPVVFCDTGLEYPEIREFVKATPNVTIIRPKMNFRDVIRKYGYPVISKEQSFRIRKLRYQNLSSKYREQQLKLLGKKWQKMLSAPFNCSEQCCEVMKKRPFHQYERETGRKGIVATMACESRQREQMWEKYGCNAFDCKRPMSKPMSFWTEQDVLEYISANGLSYASVYGDIVRDSTGKWSTTGVKRTGCMFCMFGVQCEKEPNRFQQMKETHPKQYDFCMRSVECGGLGLSDVLQYIGVKH